MATQDDTQPQDVCTTIPDNQCANCTHKTKRPDIDLSDNADSLLRLFASLDSMLCNETKNDYSDKDAPTILKILHLPVYMLINELSFKGYIATGVDLDSHKAILIKNDARETLYDYLLMISTLDSRFDSLLTSALSIAAANKKAASNTRNIHELLISSNSIGNSQY